MPDLSNSYTVPQGQHDTSPDRLLVAKAIERDKISFNSSQCQKDPISTDPNSLSPMHALRVETHQSERDSSGNTSPCTGPSMLSLSGLPQQEKEKCHTANALRFALLQIDPRCFITGVSSANLLLHYVLEPNHQGLKLWRKLVSHFTLLRLLSCAD